MADASQWYNPLSWLPPNQDDRPKTPGEAQGILSWFRRAFTGWPGNEVAPGTGADRELRTERVRSGPSGVIIPWFLPYFDDQQTLSENQAMRLAYRKMLADPNVKAAFLGKVLAVSSLDLKIIPADKKDHKANRIADFVRWNLTEALSGGIPNLIWSIISGALIDGYSVSEKVWDLERRGAWEGHYYILNVKPKDTGRDVVLMTDEFRNIVGVQGLRYNPGEVFHPSQFLIYRHLPLWDTATGVSDFRACYSRWWLLDTVLKLRAIGLEKRSLPVLLGTYQTAQQRPSLESTLADVKSQNWLAVPEGVRVEALNIAGSGDSQFADAVRDLKHDIFLGIQGAILQSLEGSVSDGRGSSQVHRTTADLFVWHLSQAIQQVLNDRNSGLIRDIVDLNFVTDAYPKAVLGAIDVGELSAELDLDSKLIGMGLSLSKDEMYEKYGRKPPDPDNPDDELSQAKQQADAAKAQQGAGGGNPLAALMGGAGGDGQPGAPPPEPEQPDQPDAPDAPLETEEQPPEPDAPEEPNDDLTLFAEMSLEDRLQWIIDHNDLDPAQIPALIGDLASAGRDERVRLLRTFGECVPNQVGDRYHDTDTGRPCSSGGWQQETVKRGHKTKRTPLYQARKQVKVIFEDDDIPENVKDFFQATSFLTGGGKTPRALNPRLHDPTKPPPITQHHELDKHLNWLTGLAAEVVGRASTKRVQLLDALRGTLSPERFGLIENRVAKLNNLSERKLSLAEDARDRAGTLLDQWADDGSQKKWGEFWREYADGYLDVLGEIASIDDGMEVYRLARKLLWQQEKEEESSQ